jgi:polysaccharide biosynthesis protein PslG
MFRRSPRGPRFAGVVLLALGALAPWAFSPSAAADPAASVAPVAALKHAPRAIVRVPAPHPTHPVAAPAPAPAVVYGISDPALPSQTAPVQVEQLKAMKAMGNTSVRIDANWASVQPNGPGSYSWAALDQAVASVHQVGLTADLIIDGCPRWAAVSSAAGDQFAQPASTAQFATWAGAVAARYGSEGAEYFEIWNEPNLAVFWAPEPNPAAYTSDLKAAYKAVKAGDPSAVVLSGGLAPADNDGTNDDPRTFLEDMYADGAKGSFDGVGFHPYSYPDSPATEASWSGWSMMSQTSPSVRSIMTANGDSGKKVWITEYGAPTSGPNSVGESEQSTDLVQAISQAQTLGWIGSVYIYTWSDLPSLPADENGFGLLTVVGERKPAYGAVTAALASAR